MPRYNPDIMVRPPLENIWYNTFDNFDDAVKSIQEWEEILETDEYFEKLYKDEWTQKYTDFDKANLKRRTSCLMRILILRAQNIVVTDFENFPNRFYKPGRNLNTR